jgi:hypothetical protein
MSTEILQLAREAKLIRSGLPLDELVRRSKLIDRLEKQFGDVKSDVKKFERVGKEAAKEAKTATKNVNTIRGQVTKDLKKLGNEINNKTKPLQDAYKKVDKGVQRLTKGLDKFAAAAGIGFGIAGVVISFMALWSSERNQAAFDNQVDAFQGSLSRQGSFNQLIQNRFKKLREDFDTYKKRSEKTFDYQSQDIKQARSIADRARKLANDGLYEARTRISRLNDVAAEARSNASKALVQNNAIKQQVTTVDTKLRTVESKATNAASEAQQARVGVRLVNSKATNAAADAKQARIGIQLVDSKATTALTTTQQLSAKIPGIVQSQIQPAIAPIKAKDTTQDAEITALKNNVRAIQNAPKTNTPTPNTPSPASLEVIRPLVNQAVNNSISGYGILPRLGAAEVKADLALKQSQAALTKPELEPIGRSAIGIGANNAAAIDKLNNDIQQLGKAPNVLEPRVTAVETKIREREKMDAAANQKLDYQTSQLEKIAIVAGGLTLMAPAIINNLGPKIDALPGTTAAAVAAQPCNGKGCGGKTADRVNNLGGQVDGIDKRLNDLGSRLDAFNAASNTAQLGMLKKIDATTTGNAAKLGVVQNTLNTVSGAVDKTFTLLDKFAKWSRLGYAMQVLQTWMILHNALMLSDALKVTLVSIVQNGYNFFQVKDVNGEIIDVNEQLNHTIVSLIDNAIGEENREGLTIAFKKANRIYQAAANVFYSVTSIVDVARTVAEVAGERISKIGNALRAGGVLSDRAYGYMGEVLNPATSTEAKIQNLYEKVQPFQEGLDAIETISQVPQNTVDAFTGLAQAEKELTLARQGRDEEGNSIEQQVKAANKSPEIQDPVAVGRPE